MSDYYIVKHLQSICPSRDFYKIVRPLKIKPSLYQNNFNIILIILWVHNPYKADFFFYFWCFFIHIFLFRTNIYCIFDITNFLIFCWLFSFFFFFFFFSIINFPKSLFLQRGANIGAFHLFEIDKHMSNISLGIINLAIFCQYEMMIIIIIIIKTQKKKYGAFFCISQIFWLNFIF